LVIELGKRLPNYPGVVIRCVWMRNSARHERWEPSTGGGRDHHADEQKASRFSLMARLVLAINSLGSCENRKSIRSRISSCVFRWVVRYGSYLLPLQNKKRQAVKSCGALDAEPFTARGGSDKSWKWSRNTPPLQFSMAAVGGEQVCDNKK
jgi:hypothetical protein